eukprot:jgi/Psemu1/23192/gm1.23192_g
MSEDKGERKKKKRSNSRFQSFRNTFKGAITELKHHDVRATLTEMEVTIITAKEPASHDRKTIKDLTPLEAKNWEFDIKEYHIAAKDLKDNLSTLFDKPWGQCDLGMQNKVKSHAGWKSAVKKSNVIDDSTYSPSSDDEYNADSSHDKDNDPSMNHPLAPAGVTNAIADANDGGITIDEDAEALDTDITGVAHERNEDTQPDPELTGVATVTSVGTTGVTNRPDQPSNTDDENTGKEDDESSTATEQHDSEENTQSSSYGRRLNQGQYRCPMADQFEYQHFQGTLDGGTIKTSEQIEPLSTHEKTNYNSALQHIETSIHQEQMIEDYILTQYSLQTGLKKFGKAGMDATMKELKQMMAREVFGKIDYKELNHMEKEQALPILLFLTMKRDKKSIKGQACADGRKQSPTIAPEALFYTLIVDAMEE